MTSLDLAERKRLTSILGMLGSNAAGERDNAARLAEHFRREHGLTWAELLNLPTSPVAVPAPPPPPRPPAEPPAWVPPKSAPDPRAHAPSWAKPDMRPSDKPANIEDAWYKRVRAKEEFRKNKTTPRGEWFGTAYLVTCVIVIVGFFVSMNVYGY